ncbi:hypothetical protein C5E51_25970 [Nocardia nova]|uniref:hypothetical protein n=1 Tax=Nocardia nova TaxID=37330 RepID=UPI000CE9BF87|nr:hypothetical protein [Nocardia nova]PPJ04058.1 hypothetical protein C5E51_25970 [Nocardia nova]
MIHRPRVRSLLAATAGAALLTLGSGLLTAAPADAAPSAPVPVHDPNYPLGGDAEHPGTPEQDPQAEKAEKLGGHATTDIIELATDTTTKIVEMGADVLKCGLNIAMPSVKCD